MPLLPKIIKIVRDALIEAHDALPVEVDERGLKRSESQKAFSASLSIDDALEELDAYEKEVKMRARTKARQAKLKKKESSWVS